ncbi:hypothetical protein BKA64DRAFT_306036 [Cadophora sp. MPI-SDFR-AT-0126]|nr:hypothetical protein BKA64DRAFT_306036 [Leotiomycetes sp. MPI-SDFR-AT-0126]
MVLHRIDNLPPEILTAICSHLPRRDLKSARLSSKRLNSIASRFLFRITFLKVGINSFRKLEHIANDPVLSNYVRVISYDPYTMKNTSARVAAETAGPVDMFELWKMYDLERGLRKSKLSEKQLRPYFDTWYARVVDLEALTPSVEFNLLINIMSKLPMLHGLQYDLFATGELHTYSGEDKSVWEVSTAAAENASGSSRRRQRQNENRHQERAFWTLLHAAYASRRSENVRKIKATDMDLRTWDLVGQKANPGAMILPNLTGLDLQFELSYGIGTSNFPLKHMLCNAPLLQHLAISIRTLDSASYRYQQHFQISDFIKEGQYWKDLKHVAFEHLVTTDADLRSLLSRHQKSLRSLELKHILLHPGDSIIRMDDDVEDPNDQKGNEDVGSWLDMIEYLHTNLSLDRMKFGGILANGRNEAWKVGPPRFDHPAMPQSSFLKYKIENYICKGGTNPIDRITSDRVAAETPKNNNFDIRGLQIPYIWEDETWRLSVVELPRIHDPNGQERF